MNYLDQLRGTVEEYFPDDEFFYNLYYDLRPGFTADTPECAFTPQELKETRKLIPQLLSTRLSDCQIDKKQAHPLIVLCAAWHQPEQTVREILCKSSYDQALLEEIVALVYVYQKKWRSLKEISDFLEGGMGEERLWKIAFAAGAGANFDLIRDLRNRDGYLLHYVKEGMNTYGSASNKAALEIMLAPFQREVPAQPWTENLFFYLLVLVLFLIK